MTPRPWRGLVAGVAAGLAASAIMNLAQAAWLAAAGNGDGDGEPATEKTADALSEAATGKRVPKKHREGAGNAVHYAAGAAIGGLYGVTAEYVPAVTSGFGTLYGAGVSAVLDEGVVPALGLGDPPDEVPADTHLFGLASHIVFGLALETSRRILGGRR